MAEAETTQARETGSRTTLRGWKLPRRGRVPWWAAPLAILVLAAMVGSTAFVMADGGRATTQVWSAINLNFGSNPVTDQLNVSFARVAYLSQPAQWNTTGFINGTLTGSAWYHNSTSYGTHYGIDQLNSTSTAATVAVTYSVSGDLGANVSYFFTDQRAALNGTSTTWQYVVSEAKTTTELAATGSVLSSAAGSAQNAIWVQAAYSSGTYAFTAYDWEYKAGGGGPYQNVTAYALGTAADLPALQFFEVYVYAQPTQTVVSIVNTTDGAVFASTAAMHPVLDKNLTSVAYLGDTLTGAASGTYSAMILDSNYFVDHNTYTTQPGVAVVQRGLSPFAVGALSAQNVAPFDPSVVKPSLVTPPTGSTLYSNTKAALGDFQSVTNSSSVASATSSLLNTSYFLNRTTTSSVAGANQTLTTVRAQAENQVNAPSVSIYATSWTQSSIQTQIHAFLTSYVSAQTGIPAADITLPGYLVSDVSVWSQFSSQAAGTIHDYLASSIPGYLQSSNLALVNQKTGAIDAGADIGQFMDLSTGAIYAPQTNAIGGVFDPVTHEWYASAQMAGFPAGSDVSPTGAIYVPGQATFLGWNANGQPEFGTGGCFIVCLPGGGLTGAASAVSSFFGSAATSIKNAVGTTTNQISTDVVKPVSGNLSTGLNTFSGDLTQGISNVMPFVGGTLANVGSSITGTISHTLGGVTGSMGSVTSGAAGAILSGVDSFSNSVYHVGAAAGSAVSSAAGALSGGLAVVGNTVGKTVTDGAAVLSSTYASVGNVAKTVGGAVLSGTKSLYNAALGADATIAGALDSVGSTVVSTASGALSAVQNAFGALGSDVMKAIELPGAALSAAMSWLTGTSSNVG